MSKVKTINLPEELRDVLGRAVITDTCLNLPLQMTPKDYAKVKKVLNVLGVTWSRKEKTHLWSRPGAKEEFEAWLASGNNGVVNTKATLQQYDTPAALATRAVELLAPRDGDRILEPSAGVGNLISAVEELGVEMDITAVEIDPERCTALERYVQPICADFLEWAKQYKGQKFDCVLMNPPFSENQFAKHTLAAIKLLRAHGTLVAILPNSVLYSQVKLVTELRDMLDEYKITVTVLPENIFKESGTGVNVVLLKFVKTKKK